MGVLREIFSRSEEVDGNHVDISIVRKKGSVESKDDEKKSLLVKRGAYGRPGQVGGSSSKPHGDVDLSNYDNVVNWESVDLDSSSKTNIVTYSDGRRGMAKYLEDRIFTAANPDVMVGDAFWDVIQDHVDPEGKEPVWFRYQHQHDVAVYEVSKVLDMDDMVPETVLMEFGDEEDTFRATVQEWVSDRVPAAKIVDKSLFYKKKDQLSKIAAFDFLIGNFDRHTKNWLVDEKTGDISLIDHDLTFPLDTVYDFDITRQPIFKYCSQENLKIPKEVKKWKGKWDEIEGVLRNRGLNQNSIDLTRDRFDLLVDDDFTTFRELTSLLRAMGKKSLKHKPGGIDHDQSRHGKKKDPKPEDMTREQIEAYLRDPKNLESVEQKNMGTSSSTFIGTYKNGMKVMLKPSNGEKDNIRWSVPDHTAYKRDAAVYEVSKVLGMDDMVPPTVVVKGSSDTDDVQVFISSDSSAQLWIDDGEAAGKVDLREHSYNDMFPESEDFERAAAFDFLIGNTDRNIGNWLINTKTHHATLIDNGLSFPHRMNDIHARYEEGSRMMSVGILGRAIRGKVSGEYYIPDSVKEGWKDKWGEIHQTLFDSGIESEAMVLVKRRYDTLMDDKIKTFAQVHDRWMDLTGASALGNWSNVDPNNESDKYGSFLADLNRELDRQIGDKHLEGTPYDHDQSEHGRGQSGDITQTEKFKSWFGNSKIVDGDGNPRLVYHGTSHEGIEKIYGGFFAENKKTTSEFGPVVVSAYLKMEKPAYDISAMGISEPGDLMDLYKQFSGEEFDDIDSDIRDVAVVDVKDGFREWLISEGYDGIVSFDDSNRVHDMVYVPYSPDQVWIAKQDK